MEEHGAEQSDADDGHKRRRLAATLAQGPRPHPAAATACLVSGSAWTRPPPPHHGRAARCPSAQRGGGVGSVGPGRLSPSPPLSTVPTPWPPAPRGHRLDGPARHTPSPLRVGWSPPHARGARRGAPGDVRCGERPRLRTVPPARHPQTAPALACPKSLDAVPQCPPTEPPGLSQPRTARASVDPRKVLAQAATGLGCLPGVRRRLTACGVPPGATGTPQGDHS
jgi:hypothetical protein